MSTGGFPPVPFDAARHLSKFEEILGLPRETLPRLTAAATRSVLSRAAEELQLDLIETEGIAPLFLLLPQEGAAAAVTAFATWHAESRPVTPAAAEGAERLALATLLASLAALAEAGPERAGGEPIHPAVVVAPAAGHGSLPLAAALAAHRERLRSGVGIWPRIAASAPQRRRIFLGARGQVVLGVWGEGVDPYAIRDAVMGSLAEEAYGPRPLDFELLRKLAEREEAMDFLEEALEDPGTATGEGEARLRSALFDPRGRVTAPAVRHPERPAAWIAFETTEGMEAEPIRARVESMAGGARVETAEALPWDRIGIHHPAVRAAVLESKDRSAGPEIWPMAPWPTPSGAFTRTLGIPLLEWAVPLPLGGAPRQVTPDTFDPLVRETASILRRLAGETPPSAEG